MKSRLNPNAANLASGLVLALASAVAGCGSNDSSPNQGTTTSSGTFDTSISTGEFSFFVISMSFLKSKAPSLSCDSTGKKCTGALGGNLGGLDGADAFCTAAAKAASSSDNHQWRAYLSTSSVDAKDRIGTGPWYSAPPKYQSKTNYATDGLLFGTSSTIFSTNRPGDSTTIVWNGIPQSMGQGVATDFPFNMCYTDEFGVCVQNYGDSHDTMTGTTTAGLRSTNHCNGWTSNASSYSADLSHSWPRQLTNVGSDMNWSRSNETEPCVGIINVTTTNYMSSAMPDGGIPLGVMPDGGIPLGVMPDGGIPDGIMPDGGIPDGAMPDTSTSTWSGGVGSAGGYGGFYCFAYSI